jgi:hypothetical protein
MGRGRGPSATGKCGEEDDISLCDVDDFLFIVPSGWGPSGREESEVCKSSKED